MNQPPGRLIMRLLLTGTGRGVVYLHSRTPPIAHRDLSAKNILVDNGLNAKIADMGVSRIVNIRSAWPASCLDDSNARHWCVHATRGSSRGRGHTIQHCHRHLLLWCGISVHTDANLPQKSQTCQLLGPC